jgi:predicted metal-dependent hydrolase
VPDKLEIGLDDAIALAQRYLDDGQPFHAHEVLEALWKTQPAAERDLWQGLAQIAVGTTHALRGNTVGATTLLRRGARRVAGYTGTTYGINVGGVVTWAEDLADAPAAPPKHVTLRDAASR